MLQYADSSGSKGRHWSVLIVDFGATKKRFISSQQLLYLSKDRREVSRYSLSERKTIKVLADFPKV